MQTTINNNNPSVSTNVNQKMVVVMSGITKVFVGEIIETGK